MVLLTSCRQEASLRQRLPEREWLATHCGASVSKELQGPGVTGRIYYGTLRLERGLGST